MTRVWTARIGTAALAVLLGWGLGTVIWGSAKQAVASPTRVGSLWIGTADFFAPGGLEPSVSARIDATGTSDDVLRTTLFVTPPGGVEREVGASWGGTDSSAGGSGYSQFDSCFTPVVWPSGSTVRALFEAESPEGTVVWSSSQTLIVP